MAVYVGVRLVGGPSDGERVSLEDDQKEYYVWTSEDSPAGPERGKYVWDGHTVNPRKFWWQGWAKDGYMPL
jgi:hypothetical protein